MEKNNVIFLDIDGVLTSNRQHLAQDPNYLIWSKFDPVAIDFLNYICRKYNAKVVLTSTWADFINTDIICKDEAPHWAPHWVCSCFVNSGFTGEFGYPWRVDNVNNERALATSEYIKKHGVENYIVFDDSDYDWKNHLKPCNFVNTSSDDGMLTKHILIAKSILGTWK